MLHVPVGANSFGLTQPSWGTTRPATNNGTNVGCSTTGYSTYTQVVSSVPNDMYGMLINMNSAGVSATSRPMMVTIGVDEAGGSAYLDRIPDLVCGNADTYVSGRTTGSGAWYYFPLFVPAGSTVGAKAVSVLVTTVKVGIIGMMRPPNPSMIRKASYVDAIGPHTIPTGVDVSSGVASDGAWVSLSTTPRRAWWWQVGVQIPVTDISTVANAIHVDLAIGTSSQRDIIIQDTLVNTSTTEGLTFQPLSAGVEWDVKADTEVWVRLQASSTPDALYQVMAYGCGG